jgi:hypothetical protein
MKTKSLLTALSVIVSFSLSATVHADPGKDGEHGHHHEKKVAGPNGGRILTKINPRAEFFVTAARKVQITFLGDDGKPVAPAGQTVTMIAGQRTSPTKFTFAQEGNVLVSSAPLPAGASFPAVLQFKMSADAKPVAEKLIVDLSVCSGCSLAEYACICGH